MTQPVKTETVVRQFDAQGQLVSTTTTTVEIEAPPQADADIRLGLYL